MMLDRARKLFTFLQRRKLVVFYFAVLSLLFALALSRFGSGIKPADLARHWPLFLGAIGFELLYIIIKTHAWYCAWRAHGVVLTWLECLKLFLISVFIDLVMFPTAVASDTFKYARLNHNGDSSSRIKAIVLFRLTAVVPVVVIASAYLLSVLSSTTYALGVGSLIIIFSGWCFRKKLGLVIGGHFVTVIWLIALSTLTTLLDALRASLLLNVFGGCLFGKVLAYLSVSQMAGWFSGVPMGFGAKDVSLGYLLQGCLDPLAAISFLLMLRLTGEIFTACLGWCLASKETFRLLRQQERNSKTGCQGDPDLIK
jgi:hypothetical protein